MNDADYRQEFLEKGATGVVRISPDQAKQLLNGELLVEPLIEKHLRSLRQSLTDILHDVGVPGI